MLVYWFSAFVQRRFKFGDIHNTDHLDTEQNFGHRFSTKWKRQQDRSSQLETDEETLSLLHLV